MKLQSVSLLQSRFWSNSAWTFMLWCSFGLSQQMHSILHLKYIIVYILVIIKCGTIVIFNSISITKPKEGEGLKKINYELQDDHDVFTSLHGHKQPKVIIEQLSW